MYYTHRLRSNLQEWRNRLYKSNYENFGSNLSFFRKRLEETALLKSILANAVTEHHIGVNDLDKMIKSGVKLDEEPYQTTNEARLAAVLYQRLNHWFASSHHHYNLLGYSNSFDEKLRRFLETEIEPIIKYLQDSLEEVNFTLYLLEKYKARTEWFTRQNLVTKYQTATKSYEEIFEDDLRLFLFDQGVDYPFSTPKSSSGRADIIGNLDTNDPLVLEIKVYDTAKAYRKNRVIDGFGQIVKYANDYNKDVGYLVVFNLDNIEIKIVNAEPNANEAFPNRVMFNDKTYFILFINLNSDRTASKQGKIKVEEIREEELFEQVKAE
ncbi:hypothetical protein [Larkinella rosea]|uniref:Uncharacterized protein n=1 Tax=Larkinella rosea TaxID=2025312 RepID=A0A3P1BZU6_9BACT|nr:hypothetical protein [Larkinella rosea]RRB06303.1 hypothetical protein EHT25_00410 [Larkinella rosea]